MKNSKFIFALFMTMSVIFGNTAGFSSEEVTEPLIIKQSTLARYSNPFVHPFKLSDNMQLPDDMHRRIVSYINEMPDLKSLASTCKYYDYLLTEALQNKIFIMGPTGSGKSTLINLLFGKPLIVNNWGKLTALETMPNVNIEDGYDSVTLQPTAVVDTYNNRVIFDCPGFRDTRGAEQDWVNAQALYRLLKGNNISIVLVVSENEFDVRHGWDFNLLLNKMTEIFPDQKQLQNLLSLVISKQKNVPSIQHCEGLSNGIGAGYLSLQGKQLAGFLAASPGCIVDFQRPYYGQEGSYKMGEDLKSLFHNISYVSNPTVTPPIKKSVTYADQQWRWSSASSYPM